MRWRWLLPGVLWGLLIAALSGVPGGSLPRFTLTNLLSTDKLAHFGVYFLLTALLSWGLERQHSQSIERFSPKILAGAIAVGYGTLLEWLQYLIFVRRSAEWGDMLANTLGALTALGLLLLLRNFRWFKTLYYGTEKNKKG